jgi:hypothetical protein
MQTDPLIKLLISNLKPVRPRTVWTDALALAALGAVELGLFLAIGMERSDMLMAMQQPSFWWKLISLGLIALVSGAVAIMSFDPVRSPRRGLRRVVALIASCLAVGWILDATSHDGFSAVLIRLDWLNGLKCLYQMVALSVPAVIGLGLLMQRGAPTNHGGTALTAGLAAGAWGAFVFVFACPFDDPLYVVVWYSLSCATVTLFARLTLPRLTRW